MTEWVRFLPIAIALAACGGDNPQPTPPATGQPGQPAAPAGQPPAPGAGSGSNALPVVPKVELFVSCPPPREDGKVCEPNAVKPVVIGAQDTPPDPNLDKTCPVDQYCLPTKKGWLCGGCPERDTIRHAFKDRDFTLENNRDPFQSFIVPPPTGPGSAGAGSNDAPRDPTNRCLRADQLRVPNYGYQDLKLVGIVRQGTQRKVLMMDPGNYGHIIKGGDCVGKEKAWVKDIGDNFVCFEATDPSGTRVLEPHCPELHSKQVIVTPLPNDAPPSTRTPTTAPTVTPDAPPTTTTPPTTQPRTNPTTTTPPPPATQPPTNLQP